MTTRPTRFLVPFLCAALWLPAGAWLPAPRAAAEEAEGNFLQTTLEGLTLGTGHAVDELIVFPLLAPKPEDGPSVRANVWAKHVGYGEPEFPAKRYNVGIANNETQPLLVLGGTVLGGGHRDRLVPNDVIVPVGGRVEIRTIVASAPSETRKEALAFETSSSLAPPYLRERAEFSPTNTLVPTFVSHFLDFRNEGDLRKSLTAINASDALNVLCLPCHRELGEFPLLDGGRVVGLVTAVRGRIRSVEVFGSNKLLKAYFGHVLKSHTFASAAIAARARKLGIVEPGGGDPAKALVELGAQATKLLEQVRNAKYRAGDAPPGSVGEYLILRTANSTRGTAVALDGELVHASIFPYEPFENALFSSDLKPLDEDDGYGGTLERRGAGALSVYERRLLERLRRRGAGGGGLVK